MMADPESHPDLTWCRRLYEAKAAELILYGRALGLSHSESEDVLQETFLALMRRGTLPEQPERYALRTFRNKALNYRRSLWRRLVREFESSRWFEPADGETELERAAMRLLASLPAEQREAIVLKIWHGCTFEEVAGLQGVSPNTAAGRYRYGLQKLKNFLTGKEYERFRTLGEPITELETTRTVATA